MIKNKEIIVSGVRQESVIKIVSKIARKNNAVFNLLGKDFYFERKKIRMGNWFLVILEKKNFKHIFVYVWRLSNRKCNSCY